MIMKFRRIINIRIYTALKNPMIICWFGGLAVRCSRKMNILTKSSIS